MSGTRKGAVPAAAVEEDPNAAIVCNSPPCFMHELDPTYLGYLGREEVSTLLGTLLAAEWGDAVPDEARLRAALRRRFEALGTRPDHVSCAARGAAAPEGLGRLAPTIREALPRIHDAALRRDLERVLGGVPHKDGSRDGSRPG